MAGKLKSKSAGLRLELNTSFPDANGTESDSSFLRPSTLMSNHSSSSASSNWREDIARIVHHDPEDHTDTSLGDLKPDDFTNIQRLGEGAAGTVWKARHNPSQLVMAKKVA
jgi:hypothetical protein